MLVSQRAGSRRRQILQALNENGPLSATTLAAVVRPQMTVRCVRKVLRRLKEKGILVPHFESMPYSSGHFYRISHDRLARERAAEWLGVSSEELRQPKFFSRELQHTTKCALWAAFLRDMYPDAEIVRDVQVQKKRIFQRGSFGQDADRDSVPDIVLSFRGEMMGDSISLAIEIERTRKSDSRLAWKLNKLVNRSVLDGVVYVCESGGIRDAIAAVLKEEQLLRSPRIGHYGSAFLMFADGAPASATAPPKLYNAEGKLLPFTEWVRVMRTIGADHRRGSHFESNGIAEPPGAAIPPKTD